MEIKRFLAIFVCLAMLVCTLVGCNVEQVPQASDAPSESVFESDGASESASESDRVIDRDAHKDEDDNGRCDDCGISVLITFDFYGVNDLHGKFEDSDTQGGVDELTAYFRTAYKFDENTVLLSSGDMWQGSFESNATRGMIITDWMNELDFVSMTLGNHEYDWGEEYIEKNAEAAEFPFLAINVYEKSTGERVDYCAPSVLIERDGIKIGIIGAIGDCYSSISGEMVEDVFFKTGSELTALVKAESEKLRAEGADIVVYSLHDGYGKSVDVEGIMVKDEQIRSYYDPTLSDGYVDLVFEGHSHMNYVLVDSHGVYHFQNGGDNRGISHAEITLNFANGNKVVTEAEFVEASKYLDYADDPIVDELMEKYADVVGAGSEILGKNGRYRDARYLCQLVADLYYEIGVERWGDEYELALGGGFISIRSPKNIAVGDVTYSQLAMLFPFDNRLVLCSVKGRDLQRKFFETSNSNYYIAYGEYGESIRNNIDPNATYYILTDTYCSSYAYNNLTVVDSYDAGVFARDLVADYIRDGRME